MSLMLDLSTILRTVQQIGTKREGLLKVDPYKRVADECEVHHRTVYKWATREKEIPADRGAEIIDALLSLGLGDPNILDEVSDVLKAKQRALLDNEVTPVEAAEYHDECREAIVVLHLTDLAMQQRAGLR